MVNLKKLPRKLVFLSVSARQTKKLGELLAKEFLRTEKKDACVLALKGDLGGGKTTFAQGFAKGLGIKEKILSPTFVLVKRFDLKDLRFKNFYHLDCYRIASDKELFNLGLKGLIANKENIVAIEWPNILKSKINKDIIVEFEFLDEKTRKITFTF